MKKEKNRDGREAQSGVEISWRHHAGVRHALEPSGQPFVAPWREHRPAFEPGEAKSGVESSWQLHTGVRPARVTRVCVTLSNRVASGESPFPASVLQALRLA